MRSNIEGNRIEESLLAKGLKFGVQVETHAAAWTMDRDAGTVQVVTLTGAGRTVTLPAVEEGLFFFMLNVSASALDITVANPAAATIGTISQNEGALIICAGGAWIVTLVGTST